MFLLRVKVRVRGEVGLVGRGNIFGTMNEEAVSRLLRGCWEVYVRPANARFMWSVVE